MVTFFYFFFRKWNKGINGRKYSVLRLRRNATFLHRFSVNSAISTFARDTFLPGQARKSQAGAFQEL